MSLNLSGAVLEGVRVGASSNQYLYPPRNFVQSANESSFQATTRRSDYLLWPTGQAAGTDGLIISDDSLRFNWSRNDDVFRFDYISASQRFAPAVGGTPTALGVMSNTTRLVAPIPSVSDLAISPYQIYLGLPRIASLTIQTVESPAFFSNTTAGIVQIALSTGELNFSSADLVNPSYSGVSVYVSRQDFYDRSSFSGTIASIDTTGDYLAYLNPIPASGQPILLRVGGGDLLTVVTFPQESSMPVPSISGTAHVALDTGRVLLANPAALEGLNVMYEGIALGQYSLTNGAVGPISASGSQVVQIGSVPAFVGLEDPSRYYTYSRKTGKPDYFLLVELATSTPDLVTTGRVVINTSNGAVFISQADSSRLNGYELRYVDSYILVDQNITFQVYRSGLNGTGVSTVPDFIEFYNVVDATVKSGLTSSPFVILPATPVVNASLEYKVSRIPGSSGTYTGTLAPAQDESQFKPGYYLDSTTGQLFFTQRSLLSVNTTTLTSSFKIPNSPVYNRGFTLSANGSPLSEDSDYSVDYASGLITFLEDRGDGSPLGAVDLSGTADPYPSFTTSQVVFTSSYVGLYIYVATGPNAGYRKIIGLLGGNTVALDSAWAITGSVTVDIKSQFEIVADNFWQDVSPSLKKFSLSVAQSASGPYISLTTSEFSVLAEVGQINLARLTEPDRFYKAEYISLGPDSFGLNTVPTNRTEILPTKIKSEQASYTAGSRQATINPSSKNVVASKGLRVTINGLVQNPNSYSFSAPSTVNLTTILTDQTVLVDYWVEQTVGGTNTFNTQYTPLLVDYATFAESSNVALLNGDLTTVLSPQSAILLDTDVYLVVASSFNSTLDATTVTLNSAIRNTYQGGFKASRPLEFSSPIVLPATFAVNSAALSIPGYSAIFKGSLIKLNTDLYYVQSATYNASTNRTDISLSGSLFKNYVNPGLSVSSSTVNEPGSEFFTKFPLISSQPFSLFKEGSENRELVVDVDYTMGDGGIISLSVPLVYGDLLLASYVSRRSLSAGTSLSINYAYQISPDSTNGLIGQKLSSDYTLYNPDSFYFRKETIESFLPELSESLSTNSAPSPSGPTTEAPPALGLKDNGLPSLEFNTRKYYNLSLVDRRILLYYNDITNAWNTLQGAMDGRVIGGIDGVFKFNDTEGAVIDSIEESLNNIYDRIYLYSKWRVTSFFPFTFSLVPTYRPLSDYSVKSRLFPTLADRNFALNNRTSPDYEGESIGNVNLTNITKSGTAKSAVSVSFFNRVSPTVVRVDSNGSPDDLVPAFAEGSYVQFYDEKGSLNSYNFEIVDISESGGLTYLTLDGLVPFASGCVALNNRFFTTAYTYNKFYTFGSDIGIDADTGDVLNISSSFLQALDFQQEVVGDAIYTASFNYGNTETAPKRIPALFGGVKTDDEMVSVPLMKYLNELDSLLKEKSDLQDSNWYGSGTCYSGYNTIDGISFSVSVGDRLMFTNGPNANLVVNVILAFAGSATIAPGLPFLDAAPYTLVNYDRYEAYQETLSSEIEAISTSATSAPVAPAKIGTIDSELTILDYLARNYGESIFSGTATILSSNTVSVPGFIGVTGAPYFIYIASGSNAGYYKVASFLGTVLTIDPTFPYGSFAAVGSTSIELIERYSFLSDEGTDLMAQLLKESTTFKTSTESWIANPDPAQFSTRLPVVTARIAQVNAGLDAISSVCSSGDSLYDRRYLWIAQLTDKQTGFLTQQNRSQSNLAQDRANLLAAQQKRLAIQSLI